MKKVLVLALALAVVSLISCKPKKPTSETTETKDTIKTEVPAPDTTKKVVDTAKKATPNVEKKEIKKETKTKTK